MSIIQAVVPLDFVWATRDPFLFCVHHLDFYPRGNEQMGPDASLEGRKIGMDFAPKDGWRMYHGDVIPGFPQHPHRGFETVTLARQGYIDHADSLGATARFGHGDVQWMTAGAGIVHSEMFPLVNREEPNTCELFQIWLNLPRKDKMVDAHFTMLWNHTIPEHVVEDDAGRKTTLRIIAGSYGEVKAPSAPPNSRAAADESDVAIWTVQMQAGAQLELPPARSGSNRTVYFFDGDSMSIADKTVQPKVGVHVQADVPLPLKNGDTAGEVLVLQGAPIREQVVQHGPFVMNSREEIVRAFMDYQRTEFGGWPWDNKGPVHAREEGRFAIHADGRRETPAE